jgi:hypothetical protein
MFGAVPFVVASSYACCRDLRAACRTPFNGLSCSDVEAFCKDDARSSRLLHWSQHQLHRTAVCAAYTGTPYNFISLKELAAANTPAGAQKAAKAAGPSSGVGAALAALAARTLADPRVGAAAVVLGAALVLVALVGMVTTLRSGATHSGAAAEDGGSGRHADGAHRAPLLGGVHEDAMREDSAYGVAPR